MIAYVVTQNDTVYMFNALNCSLVRSQSLAQNGEVPADCKHLAACPAGATFGILGTPVIDLSTETMYLVTATQSGTYPNLTYYHRLHALSLVNLAEQNNGPVQICQNGCGGVSSSTFSMEHLQRPGLLWLSASQTGLPNPMVYTAFSMIDGDTHFPPGWIFAYNAQNLQDTAHQYSYETTPGQNAQRGGIWQGGAALAAGPDVLGGQTNFIYFSTGDGTFDVNTGGNDVADSFIKLNVNLSIPGGVYSASNYYTPSDFAQRQTNDLDFGSGGTVLFSANGNQYATKADKKNLLWTINPQSPGGLNGALPEPPIQIEDNSHQDRSTPAFWAGSVDNGDLGEFYVAGESVINRYPVRSSCPAGGTPPVCNAVGTPPQGFGRSVTPAVSSNSNLQNGIVWMIRNYPPGNPVLYAFDASLNELYDSGQCVIGGIQVDQPGEPTKFSVPTVANGLVYVATKKNFNIYGLLSQQRTC